MLCKYVLRLIIIAVLLNVSFEIYAADEKVKPKPKKDRVYASLEKTNPRKGVRFMPALEKGKQWKLSWQDEFDGKKIDEKKWGIKGDGVRKAGWWLKECVHLNNNGHLVITTKKAGDRYGTGGISSRGKYEQRYGYYVIRCKFTKCKGHGPAFWLNTSQINKVGNEGRDGTEIDIMEKFYDNERVQHAMHWDGYGEHHKSADCQVNVKGINDGWHTFSLFWTPDEYVFYVDGEETWRTKKGGVSQVPSYVIISDEIRGWNGDIKDQQLPHYFYVDYVRVYETADAAIAKSGKLKQKHD